MVNRMEELNSLNISQNKNTHQYISRSERAKPEGELKLEIYGNYYDVNNTITTAQTSNPNDEDNTNYNQERVFEALERNAPFLTVANDEAAGGATLYVIASHSGGQHFTRERPIYPQQFKVYYNIYELRLRSPVQGAAYRVSEYDMGVL